MRALKIIILSIVLMLENVFPPYASSAYAADEIIVKFKASAANQIRQGLSKSFINFDMQKLAISEKLKILNKKHGLNNIRPVFSGLHSQMQLENVTAAEIMNKRVKKYANRFQKVLLQKNISQPRLEDIYLLEFDGKVDMSKVTADYLADPAVEYIEPNYAISTMDIPNDPYYSTNLWGLHKIGCQDAWDISSGEGIVVAVLDSGINSGHMDLSENIWKNETELLGVFGVDDDGNGFVDDTWGWDFSNDDNEPDDDYYHGTHCSGIIAAVGNNSVGVIGVAPKAQLMAVKCLTQDGEGDILTASKAIYYAVDNGADILNCSWSGAGISKTLKLAFDYAALSGVVSIAAAGNDNDDVSDCFPGNIDSVVAVGSVTSSGAKAATSNYGDKIAVSAPGENILSTYLGNTYATTSGTSMACPHVSGVAALLLGVDNALSVSDIRNLLKWYSDPFSVVPSVSMGVGIINAYQALLGLITFKLSWAADFDGNNKYDIVWANLGTNEVQVSLDNGDTATYALDDALIVRPIADLNSDGKDDLAILNQDSGEVVVWLMDGVDILAYREQSSFALEYQKQIESLSWYRSYYVLAKNLETSNIHLWLQDIVKPIAVPLDLSCQGAYYMMISEDLNFTNAVWENYKEKKYFTLSSGVGTKRIYVQFKNANGRIITADPLSILVSAESPSLVFNN